MVERYRERLKREDRRAGGIIAASYNLARASESDPLYDWWDFFAEWKEDRPEPREQTEEEMFEVMKLFAAAHPEGLSH